MCDQFDGIKKALIIDTTAFVAKRVPGTDPTTLDCVLELVVVGGTHGSLTPDQLLTNMRHILTHIPTTCSRTLMTLADMLGLDVDKVCLTKASHSQPTGGYSIELPLMTKVDAMKGKKDDFILKVN